MSQELVKVIDSQELATVVESFVDDGLTSTASLKPGQLKFVQPMTSEVGDSKPGQIYDTLLQRSLDEITLVPLKVSNARAYFPEGEGLKAPVCKSDNGVTPADYVEHKQSSFCKGCKHAQWGSNKKKPACSEQIRMLAVEKETDLPYYLTFKGTGFAEAKEYINRVKLNIQMLAKGGTIGFNLRDHYFTLSLFGPMTSVKGKYWVPRFTKEKRQAEAGKYDDAFKIFASYAGKDEEEEAVQVDAATNSHINNALGIVDAEIADV